MSGMSMLIWGLVYIQVWFLAVFLASTNGNTIFGPKIVWKHRILNTLVSQEKSMSQVKLTIWFLQMLWANFSYEVGENLSQLVWFNNFNFFAARTSEDGSTTYLITRKPVSVYGLSVPSLSEFSPNITHSPCSRRNLHMEKLKNSIGKMRVWNFITSVYFLWIQIYHWNEFFFQRRSSVDSFVSKRQVPLFSPTRIQDREMNGMVNEQMEKDIESMPLSKKTWVKKSQKVLKLVLPKKILLKKFRQWFSPRGIHPFWLCFTSDFLRPEGHHDAISQFRHRHNNANIWYFESKFARQSDSLFRLYLYSSCLIELAIITIKLTTPRLLEADKLKWALGGSTITVVISLAVTYITPRRLTFISRMILWLVISTCLLLCSSVDIITVSFGKHILLLECSVVLCLLKENFK